MVLEDAGAEISDPDATVTRRDGYRVQLSFDPDTISAADLIARVSAAYPTRDLFVENPPIEETVARVYGQESGVREPSEERR